MDIPKNSKNISPINNLSKADCEYPYEIFSKKYFEHCQQKCLEKSSSPTKSTNKIDIITNVNDTSLNKIYINEY